MLGASGALSSNRPVFIRCKRGSKVAKLVQVIGIYKQGENTLYECRILRFYNPPVSFTLLTALICGISKEELFKNLNLLFLVGKVRPPLITK